MQFPEAFAASEDLRQASRQNVEFAQFKPAKLPQGSRISHPSFLFPLLALIVPATSALALNLVSASMAITSK